MRGKMVSLAMGNRCGGVGVGCEVMEFGDPFVRALWHSVLLGKQQSILPAHLRQMAEATGLPPAFARQSVRVGSLKSDA
jgi:hypothetical protein